MDLQLGWIRSILAEPHRDKQKKFEAYEPSDFSVYGKPVKIESTPDQQLAFVKAFVVPQLQAKLELDKRMKQGVR